MLGGTSDWRGEQLATRKMFLRRTGLRFSWPIGEFQVNFNFLSEFKNEKGEPHVHLGQFISLVFRKVKFMRYYFAGQCGQLFFF